ncbi:hypothetical protein ACH5A3_21875 [Streptomyces echinatus]|uniref:hypothetical protein n=1 Tax=Streptomyces echinatus TaxID=67293 RepID=UPI0037A48112
MTDPGELTLHVKPLPEGDLEELTALTARLHAELLDVDVAEVVPIDQVAPERAKGWAALAGSLAVRFATLDGLRTVVSAVRGWAQRTNRTVEINLGGDVLKVTGVTSAQQEKIIDVWLARHTTGA